MWVLKVKGQTHYIHHLVSEIGFSTRETPDNAHTKGSLRLKGDIRISEEDGKTVAYITAPK